MKETNAKGIKKKRYIYIIVIVIILMLFLCFLKSVDDMKREKHNKQYEYITYFNQVFLPENVMTYTQGYQSFNFDEYTYTIKFWDENGINDTKKDFEFTLKDDIYKIPHYTSLEELNVHTQAFYKSMEQVENIDKELEKGKYVYYLSLKQPTELKELFKMIKPYLENNMDTSGLLWIPIESSYEDSDTCIGMTSDINLMSSSFFYGYDQHFGDLFSNENFYFSQELKFLKQLKFMMENEDVLSDIMISDETIHMNRVYSEDDIIIDNDMRARLPYLYKNGIKPLGIVLYADESFMKEDTYSNFNLLKVNKLD